MDSLKKEWFPILDWPGNSPSLNPIKNCWLFIKKKLRLCGRDMSRDYVKKLSASMPRRHHKVIDQKGEMTKY